MRKIFVVGPSKYYYNWMQGELTDQISLADLVVFTGGEDVYPGLYNEPAHPYTSFNRSRDHYETAWFEEALDRGKHMIGICRGSQFLCVKSGGKLVQHQDNPFSVHPIETLDGITIDITSTHHQAQYPYLMDKDNYKLLGWTRGISRVHQDGGEKELSLPDNKEAEIVYYPKTKALCIQGHPESMMGGYSEKKSNRDTIDYLRNLLDRHLTDTI